jgi:hypothetical protein
VQLTWWHRYIGGIGPAAPIGKETLTFRKFKNFVDFLNVSSTYVGANWSAAPPVYW